MNREYRMWEHSYWGNSISWFNIDSYRITGFSHQDSRINVGDYILSEMQSGKIARFVVLSIDYEDDPKDMFFADLAFMEYCYQ